MKNERLLTYTGIAMAIISAIVYLLVVFILINGFEVDYSKEEIISFLFSGSYWSYDQYFDADSRIRSS